jgi:RNA polymerase sigma factor (sigma-70 family)
MDSKAETFQSLRPRLVALAYRMLGTRADAEDVLHDAWLRWNATDTRDVQSSEAWLKTTVTRLSIDRLRRAKVEREHYEGPWLPEPLSDADMSSPELALERDEDVSIAFLTLLETLSPEERAVFVLHDILDDDYSDIAEMIGKSQAACRQMVHRARERLTAKRRRYLVDDATRRRMLERFIEAANRGDRQEIMSLFASDSIVVRRREARPIARRTSARSRERRVGDRIVLQRPAAFGRDDRNRRQADPSLLYDRESRQTRFLSQSCHRARHRRVLKATAARTLPTSALSEGLRPKSPRGSGSG